MLIRRLKITIFGLAPLLLCLGCRKIQPAQKKVASPYALDAALHLGSGVGPPSPIGTGASPSARAAAWALFNAFWPQADFIHGRQPWTPYCTFNSAPCGSALEKFEQVLQSFHAANESLIPINKRLERTPQGLPAPGELTMYDSTAMSYASNLCGFVKPPCGPGADTSVNFPPGSTVARFAWQVIPKGAPTYTVPVFNPDKPLSMNPSDNQAENFPELLIDTNPNLHCPQELRGLQTVPLNCFYHVALRTADDLNKYMFDTDVKDTKVGDTLILLAFHIMRKQPDGNWIFTTFWWQHTAPACPASVSGCPPPASSMWAHYVMDTVELPTDPNTVLHPVFNPYFEGTLTVDDVNAIGVQSNCAVCHSYAMSPIPAGYVIGDIKGPAYGAAGGPTTTYGAYINAHKTFDANPKTDHLWSVENSRDN
jgi:hypothetical protein